MSSPTELDETLSTRLRELATWLTAQSQAMRGLQPFEAVFKDITTPAKLLESFSRDDVAAAYDSNVTSADCSPAVLILKQREAALLSLLQKAMVYGRKSRLEAIGDGACELDHAGSSTGAVPYAITKALSRIAGLGGI